MSYRHIKGLTLRHNDIRASDGELTKTRGSHGFKSYVETFVSAVRIRQQQNTRKIIAGISIKYLLNSCFYSFSKSKLFLNHSVAEESNVWVIPLKLKYCNTTFVGFLGFFIF